MGLAGNLGEFHLGELLQVLGLGRKTGLVTIKGDVASGRLALVSGRVVDAVVDDGERGEAAFFALMGNAAGSFRFLSDAAAADVPPSIDRALNSLLLDGTHPPG
jgi:hypothetical protein